MTCPSFIITLKLGIRSPAASLLPFSSSGESVMQLEMIVIITIYIIVYNFICMDVDILINLEDSISYVISILY